MKCILWAQFGCFTVGMRRNLLFWLLHGNLRQAAGVAAAAIGHGCLGQTPLALQAGENNLRCQSFISEHI